MTTRPISTAETGAALADRVVLTQRTKTAATAADQLTTTQLPRLRAALDDIPEIRPDVLARAHALATDPAWPGPAQIEHIAQLLATSPDLTNEVDG